MEARTTATEPFPGRPILLSEEASILVVDDELDQEEIEEWINLAAVTPRPTLLFAPDKPSLFQLLEEQVREGLQLPRLVFLDLHLKTKASGLESLKYLKSRAEYSEIPVIIYSQSSDPTDVHETNSMHANSYLAKGSGTTQGARFAEALRYWFGLDYFCGPHNDNS